MRIKISCAGVETEAVLNDSKTARAVWDCLPITRKVSTWGDEIYFEIPAAVGEENAVGVVEEGDLAYWPTGRCFCIFFGKTPASTATEIRPAAPVNIFGRVVGDPTVLKTIPGGATMTIGKADTGGAPD